MVKLGERINRWTVIGINQGGRSSLLCQCDCGNTQRLETYTLTSGDSKGCRECYHKVLRAKTTKTHPKWKGYREIAGTYWADLMHGAQRRSLSFDLSIENGWILFLAQNRKCALSGVELQFGKNQTASLDRIDSSLGYTLTNVQWIHKKVNFMKGKMSDSDFIDWCRLIADRQVSVI